MLSRKSAFTIAISRVLFGGTSKLRDYERTCVDWLRSSIGDDAWQVIDDQIRGVITLQRFSFDKLVLFGSLQRQTDIPLLPNRSRDLHFATVWFAVGGSRKWRCDFTAANQRLSTLEFSGPPRSLSRANLQFVECTVYADIMSDAPMGADVGQPADADLLAKISEAVTVSDVRLAATEEAVKLFVIQTGSALPPDLIRLMRETNGFEAGRWRFYGTEGRRVVLPDATYTYLAEGNDRAIAVRQGNDSAQLFLHDEIDDEFAEVGPLFVDALVGAITTGNEDD